MPQRKGKLSNLERESTGAQIFGDERRWGLNNECLSAVRKVRFHAFTHSSIHALPLKHSSITIVALI